MDFDINVLNAPRRFHSGDRDQHGWFTARSYSFEPLLQSPVVKDWIDGYTAQNTRRQKLYLFEKVFRVSRLKDPGELLKLSDSDMKSLVKRVCQYYTQHGKPNTAWTVYMTMKGFCEAHERALVLKRSERPRTPPPQKAAIESIPSKLEAYRMAEMAGSLRNRAVILCLFQSGVRDGCIGKWTYGMVGEQLYPEVKAPVRLKITPALDSKLAGYRLGYYYTFLGEEAAQALKDYIEERKRDGWTPKASDPVFVPDARKGNSKSPHLLRASVWEIVKATSARAGLAGVWPHSLRKSFKKMLNQQDAKIDYETQQALMGHRIPGSADNYFDYHDTDEIAGKYSQASWSRNGGNGQVQQLAEELKMLRAEMGKQADQLAQTRRELAPYLVNPRRARGSKAR